MNRAEVETRTIMGRYPKLPRKKKKRYRKGIKAFVQSQLDSGNWDLIESFTYDLVDPPIVFK